MIANLIHAKSDLLGVAILIFPHIRLTSRRGEGLDKPLRVRIKINTNTYIRRIFLEKTTFFRKKILKNCRFSLKNQSLDEPKKRRR